MSDLERRVDILEDDSVKCDKRISLVEQKVSYIEDNITIGMAKHERKTDVLFKITSDIKDKISDTSTESAVNKAVLDSHKKSLQGTIAAIGLILALIQLVIAYVKQ